MRDWHAGFIVVCFVFLTVLVANSGLALATTALIVTPRTFITQTDLQNTTYSLRLGLQVQGITLAPEISAALGSLEAAQYITFSSSPEEVKSAAEGIGVDYIVLVDITKYVESGIGWSFWDFVLVIPWFWHPFSFYDYNEVGVQVCVFNSQGARIFYKTYKKERRGASLLLGVLGRGVANAVGKFQHTLFSLAASDLVNAVSSDISPYLRR